MTAYSLFPAYIQIHSESQFGVHIQTLPTRAWIDPNDIDDNGSFLNWEGDPVTLDDMLTTWLTLWKVLFTPDTGFNSAILFTLVDENSEPLLKRVIPLSIVGTSDGIGQEKATQLTYSLLDTGGHATKLVALDAPLPVGFDVVSVFGSLTAPEQAVISGFVNPSFAWASRAGNRPLVFRKASYTLNDKLRRAYRMT